MEKHLPEKGEHSASIIEVTGVIHHDQLVHRPGTRSYEYQLLQRKPLEDIRKSAAKLSSQGLQSVECFLCLWSSLTVEKRRLPRVMPITFRTLCLPLSPSVRRHLSTGAIYALSLTAHGGEGFYTTDIEVMEKPRS